MTFRLQAHAGGDLIRVWDFPSKQHEILLNTSWIHLSPLIPDEIYIEGLKGGEVELELVAYRTDSYEFVGQDTIKLTIPELEWVTFDSETGEVYPVDDVIYPSDPRPEVTLDVVDAYLDIDENLVIQLHITAYDALSEVADNPADRVQSLSILVNGQVYIVIPNLATLVDPESGTMPWQLHSFSFEFDQTLILPQRPDPDDPTDLISWSGESVIVTAQTSPNAAGNVGWDRSAVVLGWRESSEFDSQMGNPYSVGAIQVGDGDELPFETYYPIVERIDNQEGSRPGSFHPMLMRMSALTGEIEEQLTFTINGAPQELRPFTFSPEKYYVVGTDESRPRIFVVTDAGLPPGLGDLKPENLVVTEGKREIRVGARLGNTYYALADAKVVVLDDEFEPSSTPLQVPSGPVDMTTLLMYYQLLYGDVGVRLLGYYQQAGHNIAVDDVLFDLNVQNNGGVFTIWIEEDISPIQAAQYLAVGLRRAMGHVTVESVIIANEDLEAFKETYDASIEAAAQVAAAGANLYLSGISIVNEGADIVMTVQDLSEGQYYAAIGLLPFISERVVTGAELVIKRLDGAGILARFDNQAIDAMAEAAKKTNFDEQFAILEDNLSVTQRLELVKGRILKYPTNYKGLRKAMLAIGPPPSTLRNPQAHHDLPWHMRDWFIAHGLDVNLPVYGRWVEGTPPG